MENVANPENLMNTGQKKGSVPFKSIISQSQFYCGLTKGSVPFTPSRHISVSHHLMRGTAVDNPLDATTHHRVISANTPQPRYSRV